jgi:TrmH family RNA methyltransferase
MPQIDHIASHSNTTIKRIRSLRDKKYRRLEGRFLAEGLRILTEAADAGVIPEILVFSSEAQSHPLIERLIDAVDASGGQIIATSRDILHKLTEKDNPQAVVGVFRQNPTLLASLDRSTAAIWVVCQSLKDPGNLGTILRTCDAVGAGGVILLDASCDPYSTEAVRASMGALFTQTLVQSDGASFFRWLREAPGAPPSMLVGASLNTDIDYQAVRYTAPTFIFMGNEQSGLPPEYEAECDVLVKLPMRGKADSLNVAVATAVLMYEVLNQQRR